MDDRRRDETQFDRLSDAQRICLRLVHQHKTSKQIAILLGISKYTVDQRIERACRTLGVEGRVQAALLLAGHEHVQTPDRIVHDPVDIAPTPVSAPSDGTPAAERPDHEPHIAQVQAAYRPTQGETGSLWNAAVPRGNARDLTPAARIRWIVQLTLLIVVALLILLVIAEGLSGIAERTWPSQNIANN